ncbi:MAG: hypothetical protein AB8G18_15925 [Gammaproteobacteria bacterium]
MTIRRNGHSTSLFTIILFQLCFLLLSGCNEDDFIETSNGGSTPPGNSNRPVSTSPNGAYLPIGENSRWVLGATKGQQVILQVADSSGGEYDVDFTNPWLNAQWSFEPQNNIIFLKGISFGKKHFPLPEGTVYFDFDASVGSSWSNGLAQIEVVNKGFSVDTPNGSFDNCIMFQETGKDGNKQYWTFAPNVGFVQFGKGSGALKLSNRSGIPTPSTNANVPAPAAPPPAVAVSTDTLRIAISPNPLATENYNPKSLESRIQQSREIGVNSMQISAQWKNLRKKRNKYNAADTKEYISVAKKYNLEDMLFVLKVIDTHARSTPDNLKRSAFDSREMWDALSKDIDHMAETLDGVKWINIGNEVNSYLSKHPDEVDDYVTLFKKARSALHQKRPGVSVGFTMTFRGFSNRKTRKMLQPLIDASDHISLTYYPLQGGFKVRGPDTVKNDFKKMRELVQEMGNKPLVLQEVGYPSSALNDSSVEKQARFFSNVMEELEERQYPIVFINYFLMSDLPDWMVDDFARYYELPDVATFKAYLKTLGVFDDKGRAKPAWEVLKQ